MHDHIIENSKVVGVHDTLVWKYCSSLFIISWTLQIAAINLTDGFDDSAMSLWLAVNMVSPAIVTLMFLKFHPIMKMWFLWKPNRRVFTASLLGVLVPIAMAFTVLFIITSFQWGDSTWFTFLSNQVTVTGGPFLLGLGQQSWLLFLTNIIITGALFALLNGFLAAGEELAWRGLLQGILIDRFGTWKGILLLGFLWSMWHLPIQLAGYNYPENPVIGSLIISPLLLIGYSIFMAWITVSAKSFIPAAIAHGAINGIQEGVISSIDIEVPHLYVYTCRVVTVAFVAVIFSMITSKVKF